MPRGPASFAVIRQETIDSDSRIELEVTDGTKIVVGANGLSGSNFAGGKVDKIAYYNTYLSDDEIGGLYSSGKGRIYESMDLTGQLLFKGKIDYPNYGVNLTDGFYIDLVGRDYPKIIDRTIIGTHVAETGDVAVGGILSSFFNDVKLSFWNGLAWAVATYSSGTITWSTTVTTFPTELINYAYENKKAWTVVKEILERIDIEFYMDYDKSASQWYLRTFVPETVYQYEDEIAYGENLISLSEYGSDTTELVNRSIIYGKTESDNILLLKTEEDTSSQDDLWIKDRVIKDGSLVTMDDVQDKANFDLEEGLNIPSNGRVSVVGLTSIRPGNMINVTVPYTGINGRHKIDSFTHSISGNKFTSNVELTKKIKTVKDLFLDTANPDDFTSGFSNPNSMTDSYSVYFDEDPSIMMHSTTVESGGRLYLEGTQTSGHAYATVMATDRPVKYCELRRYEGYSVVTDTYDVTNDGGSNWYAYSTAAGNLHTFGTVGGTVSFKINMSRTSSTATSPAYESVSMLYKGE